MIKLSQAEVDAREDRNREAYLNLKRWELDHVRSLLRGERGAAPATERHAQNLRRRSSLSRSDPMPSLFVVGLALLVLFAIFGFISIGQFLQRIWGG